MVSRAAAVMLPRLNAAPYWWKSNRLMQTEEVGEEGGENFLKTL